MLRNMSLDAGPGAVTGVLRPYFFGKALKSGAAIGKSLVLSVMT